MQLHAAECHTNGKGAACSPWVATWGTAMVEAGSANAPDISGQTLRQIIHTSIGGSQTRIWLSNRFGTVPLHIGGAHIAISVVANPSTNTEMSAILPASDRTLTFNHRPSVTIAPGSTIVSDAVALDAGEQALYPVVPNPDAPVGYSIIAYLPNPSHTADALIIAGSNSQATDAAGEFLTSEVSMERLLKRFPSNQIPYFEVLLKTTRLNGTPFSADIVTVRTY
jgi:hypothetical protein